MGQVTGTASFGGVPCQVNGNTCHAFLYSGGNITDIGTLGDANSLALSINDAGQVVGSSDISSGVQHAFLYSDGLMTDLNTLINPSLGITLSQASGINDAGQIIAGAFLLTPKSETTVPEPSTLSMISVLLCAFLSMGTWRCRGAREL